MATVKLTNVKKIYDNSVVAVHDFNLEIADKEFVVFVGPSGCGKSTTLRMIAGLEDISEGTVEIDGVVVNDFEPRDRDVAMVFQNYALYPHLSVFENMAFALRIRKVPNAEIYRRVTETAEVLGITEYLTRKPKALSGGQRQRVAIGRAMVRESKVFLMDEPLSNLDAKLRNQMRAEIIRLRKKIDSTFIYVTHDQTEAMTLGDRIVIMKSGYIQQVGTPTEVFEDPVNLFVAGFIGAPQMNFFNTQLINEDGKYYVTPYGTRMELSADKEEKLRANDARSLEILREQRTAEETDQNYVPEGEEAGTVEVENVGEYASIDDYIAAEAENMNTRDVILGVRPEHITIVKEGEKESFPVTIEVNEMMGSEYHIHAICPDGEKIIIRVATLDLTAEEKASLQPGNTIYVHFGGNAIHVFDPESTRSLMVSPDIDVPVAGAENEDIVTYADEGKHNKKEKKTRDEKKVERMKEEAEAEERGEIKKHWWQRSKNTEASEETTVEETPNFGEEIEATLVEEAELDEEPDSAAESGSEEN